MSTRTVRGQKEAAGQATATATMLGEPQEQAGEWSRLFHVCFDEKTALLSTCNSTADDWLTAFSRTDRPSPTITGGVPQNGATETIGSRLRKRRRTGSSPTEDMSPAPKRASSKRATPAARARDQGGSPDQEASASLSAATPQPSRQTMNLNDSSARATKMIEAQDSATQTKAPFEGSSTQNQGDPDFNTVIADIINHGETVDNHYASRGYTTMATGHNGHLGASFTLKTQSLPVLENLATQILEIMAKSTYHEILTIATKPDTDPGHAYATLKSLFDHTKKVYSVQEHFLSPYELGLVDNGQIEIIRKANMATFVSSVFGSEDVGFYHLNENFIDTFVSDAGRLLKNQAQLFLDLKTQAYISAVQNTDRSREEILEDLFPHDLEDRLMRRRPGAKRLAPSEAEFVQRAGNRRKALLEEASNQLAIKKLPDKYVWEDFLRDVSAYVSKNFEAIAGIAAPRSDSAQQTQGQQIRDQQRNPQRSAGPQGSQMQQPVTYDGVPSMHNRNPQSSTVATHPVDEAEKVAQAAQYAMPDINTNHDHAMPGQYQQQRQSVVEAQTTESSRPTTQDPPQIQYHFEHPLHPNVPAPPPPYFQNAPYQYSHQQWNGHPNPVHLRPVYTDQIIPYPTQSAPTQILYERARQAATVKTSPTNRRAGHPSQRRPWTTEEESCLMAGLDRVKGPHWSQILAMFGPGGTISETLKDRNQVQLKDKARNLKLFFLKSGIEVPYYLQFVTGELKTRAPARARREEEEGGRKGAEEARAHVEGLMALVGGKAREEERFAGNGNVGVADMGVGVGYGNGNRDGGNGVAPFIDPEVTRSAGGAHTSTDGGGQVDGLKGEIQRTEAERTT